jgi:hypothetical protein
VDSESKIIFLRRSFGGVIIRTVLRVQIEHSSSPLGDEYAFTVLDARCTSKGDTVELHCVSTSIVDDEEKVQIVSRASTDLHWIVFEKSNLD